MRNFVPFCSGILLAFAAGFVDTATFLRVSELFSAHITGNFVVFAIALARGLRQRDWLKVIALPVFFVGVLLAAFLFDRAQHKVRAVFIFEAVLLVAVGGLGLCLTSPAADGYLAMILVLAMAAQNAAHQVAPELGPTTAVMTTNAAKLFVSLGRAVSRLPPAPRSASAEMGSIAARMAWFALGCVVAAFSTRRFGFGAILLPALLVTLVAVLGTDGPGDRVS